MHLYYPTLDLHLTPRDESGIVHQFSIDAILVSWCQMQGPFVRSFCFGHVRSNFRFFEKRPKKSKFRNSIFSSFCNENMQFSIQQRKPTLHYSVRNDLGVVAKLRLRPLSHARFMAQYIEQRMKQKNTWVCNVDFGSKNFGISKNLDI